MKIRYKFNIVFLLIASLSLAACNNRATKQETPTVDVYETEQFAIAAYEKNDWGESEKHYSELIRRIPENPVHWFRLGNVYARTQRPDAAVVAYREALVRDPKMAKAWYNMGVLQLKQAANSFEQLRVYGDRDDALYKKSRALLNGIVELMQEKNSESKAAPQPLSTPGSVEKTALPPGEDKQGNETAEEQ